MLEYNIKRGENINTFLLEHHSFHYIKIPRQDKMSCLDLRVSKFTRHIIMTCSMAGNVDIQLSDNKDVRQ